jgi:hypothetical protein
VNTGAQDAIPGGIGPIQGGDDAVVFFVGVDDVEATLKRARERALRSRTSGSD